MTASAALVKPEESRGLDLSQYDPQAYNILSPVLKLDTAAPYLRLRAVEVRLDPDTNKGDCYAAPGTKWSKNRQTGELLPVMVAPSKPGLLKIASAAGLVIDPRNSRRIKPDSCERCIDMARATGLAARCGDCNCRFDVAYQHIGAVRTDAGWRIVKASYEWNLDAQRRKIAREGKKKLAKAREEGNAFDLDGYIEDRVHQVIAERYGLAETKPRLRLVRAICHLRQAYTREEMARPFVVVRTELAPDYADPETRRALAAKAISSGAEIFGPAEDERPVAHAPVAEVVDDLASEPDFTDAEGHADVVADSVDEEQHEDEPPLPETSEPLPDEQAGGYDEGGDADPDGEADAVSCDDCGGNLTANVVAYCQSSRGRKEFGGANCCYECQKKRRGNGRAQKGGGA